MTQQVFMDSTLIPHLRDIVGPGGVVMQPTALSVYECDGYTLEKAIPEVVVLPRSTEEVAAVVKFLHGQNVAFVPRGAGTGLSGGCLPAEAPVLVGASRMHRKRPP